MRAIVVRLKDMSLEPNFSTSTTTAIMSCRLVESFRDHRNHGSTWQVTLCNMYGRFVKLNVSCLMMLDVVFSHFLPRTAVSWVCLPLWTFSSATKNVQTLRCVVLLFFFWKCHCWSFPPFYPTSQKVFADACPLICALFVCVNHDLKIPTNT